MLVTEKSFLNLEMYLLCYLEELISLSYHNLTDSMKYAIQCDVVHILRAIRMYRVKPVFH